ncbi:MAG TPA: hypothetical protein VMV92_27070 [Streptosporangiaceae bacterium]|nr:hypothetical protein [Streptosporangiaceae bacterium]
MHRSASLSAAVAMATMPAADPSHVLLTLGPPAGGRWPEGTDAVRSAEVTRHLIEDHDRIAQRMNDIVVHRIFAAGLDLHAALGLMRDHRGTSEIYHAIDELDHAIRDIRDSIFDHSPPDPRPCPRHGGTRQSRPMT